MFYIFFILAVTKMTFETKNLDFKILKCYKRKLFIQIKILHFKFDL